MSHHSPSQPVPNTTQGHCSLCRLDQQATNHEQVRWIKDDRREVKLRVIINSLIIQYIWPSVSTTHPKTYHLSNNLKILQSIQ